MATPALTLLELVHKAAQDQVQGMDAALVRSTLAVELRQLGLGVPLIESMQRTVTQLVMTVRVCGSRLA